MKKIMILNGAARKNGNTAALIEAFTEGAKSAGNEIREFYLQGMNIHGCLGCNGCRGNADPCVQKDDMGEIYEAFQWADVVVFASPVYFGTITGTLKTANDRLYAMWNKLGYRGIRKECVLLMTAGAPMYDQPLLWYGVFTRYNGWRSLGEVLGAGKTEEAKEIGASIR